MSPAERAAERLLRDKDALAQEVTDALYAERPQLLARYGEQGREKCRQDLRFNLEHLAPAVALGEDAMFVGYVRWLVGLLAARNVPATDITRSLDLTADAVRRRFPADEAPPVLAALQAGRRESAAHSGGGHAG